MGQMAEEFELRVRDILKRLGFQDVNGGREFRLGEQIDACGGFEDFLLIIECKTTQKDTKQLLDSIRIHRGKIQTILGAARTDPTYAKYSKPIFVLATNFDIREEDIQEAEKSPRIFLWDRTFLDYYEDLTSRIGEYAKYNLLGEMGCAPRVSDVVNCPCFKTQMGGMNVYSFLQNPKTILKYSYVARREMGREKYYQRIIEKKRLRQISEYLDCGGFFPNAVIVAFGVPPTFKPFHEISSSFQHWDTQIEFGSLSFPVTYRSCWIVDGQHRLYGYSKTTKSATVMPIVAIEGATIQQQATLFLDINKNQKAVPSDLVWDLEGEMQPETPNGIVSRVVKSLNEEGRLAGRIYIPLEGPKGRGQLKMTSLCAAMKKRRITYQILEHDYRNPLYDKDSGRTVARVSASLNEAFNALDSFFNDRSRDEFWYQNNGLVIFVALYERVLERVKRVPTTEDYRKYLGPLRGHMDRYDDTAKLRSLRVRCSSEGGRDDVIAEFVRAIRRQTNDKDFAPEVPEFELDSRIKRVERGLGDVLETVLSTVSDNWFRDRVSDKVRDYVLEKRTKVGPSPGPVQDYMTFGQIGDTILSRADNRRDLRDAFLKEGFCSMEEVTAAFATVNRLRADLMHGRIISDADEMILDGYLTKFETVIRHALPPQGEDAGEDTCD